MLLLLTNTLTLTTYLLTYLLSLINAVLLADNDNDLKDLAVNGDRHNQALANEAESFVRQHHDAVGLTSSSDTVGSQSAGRPGLPTMEMRTCSSSNRMGACPSINTDSDSVSIDCQ